MISPFSPTPLRQAASHWQVVAAAAAAIGIAIGAAVVFTSPVLVVGAIVGCAAGLALLTSTRLGLLAIVAIATLLPFGVIPLRIGVQATLLDGAIGVLLLVWLLGTLHRRDTLRLTAPGSWLAAFLVVAIAAFALGAGRLVFDELTRQVVKLLASVILFYCVVNTVRSLEDVRLFARALVACSSVAALLAIAIWALPVRLQVRLLSSLGTLGYPTGDGVLRYLPGPNDTFSDTLRAVGTSIDPNVLGGMLMLTAAMVAAHVLGSRPLAPRWLLLAALGLLVAGMLVSHSRSSWLGFAAAAAFLAVVRERRALILLAFGGAILAVSPFGQTIVERLGSGFAAQDKAAAMRLGEYQNAFEIIARYPLLGIGFGDAPDVDLQEGVSSLYLALAEQTGLVGTTFFLLAVGTAMIAALKVSKHADGERGTLLSGLQAALVAALVAGSFDHYFVNKDFPHMVALLWLYIGLLVVTTGLAERHEDTAPTGSAVAASHPD